MEKHVFTKYTWMDAKLYTRTMVVQGDAHRIGKYKNYELY